MALIYIALLGLSMTAAALGGDLSLIFYKYITTSWDTECHLVPSYYTLSSLLSQYLLGLCTLLIGVARGFARVIARDEFEEYYDEPVFYEEYYYEESEESEEEFEEYEDK